MLQTISVEHIEISSEIRSGKPRIAGTRITVEDVAMMHLTLGQSLVEIAGFYNLSLAAVHAAMAYYFDHRETIDQRTRDETAVVEAIKAANISPLQAKLAKMRHG